MTSKPTGVRSSPGRIGGNLEQTQAHYLAAEAGHASERPFLLAAQPSLFDPSRAPQGGQTLWVYAHVPPGTDASYVRVIENTLERAAPGFKRLRRYRHVTTPTDFQAFSPVFQGGDVFGGKADLRGLLIRPVPTAQPWRTPDPQVLLCSASTAPGGGVHGMSGYHAALAALNQLNSP